jgi:uncharacterized membrane protein
MPVTPPAVGSVADGAAGRAARVSPIALALLFAGAYALYALFRHWRFGSSAYDLGIFDQALWHASRFEMPASSLRGIHNLLADHFHPIIFILTPLYWVAPGPEVLLVAQSLLLGASVVPVYLCARRRLLHGPALAVAAGSGLFWGTQKAAAFDFHEIAFAPVLIGAALFAMETRRWRLFAASATALVLVKEDMALLVVFLGVLLMLRGDLRRGAVTLACAAASFTAITGVVLPALSGGGYGYAGAYATFGDDPWSVVPGLVSDPARAAAALVTPPVKLRTMLLWLAPFLFLPLLSPVTILALPIALVRFLADAPPLWGTEFHYSAPLAPILAIGAAEGFSRLTGRLPVLARPAPRRALLLLMLAVCGVLPGGLPLWRAMTPRHYRTTPVHQAGYAALALVPANASIVAQAAIAPHLSHRRELYVLMSGAPEAEFVIAADRLSPWPNPDAAAIARLVDERRAAGYEVVFEREGWVVLRRGSS